MDEYEEQVRDEIRKMADEFGFGTIIEWVREGWSEALQEDGMSKRAADLCAGIERASASSLV